VTYTVLVTDDDRAIRESLARALELEGYHVVEIDDGVQALTRARRDAVDVLILDVMMPGLDGLDVRRALRADGSPVPVLMLTARVETQDRVAGLDAGAGSMSKSSDCVSYAWRLPSAIPVRPSAWICL
jgi:two-component system, OmpR family, response regulator MprA